MKFAGALFKQIAPYALIGAAISGIALAYIPNTIVEQYAGGDSWYAIPIAAAIGIPLYLRGPLHLGIPLDVWTPIHIGVLQCRRIPLYMRSCIYIYIYVRVPPYIY